MINRNRREPVEITSAARSVFQSHLRLCAAGVDKLMAFLLAAEWVGALLLAIGFSPRTWSGAIASVHPHIKIALFFGPAFVCVPLGLALLYPGHKATRHVIAVCQMLMSALLIDITNGRIETHFHVFGSLAFLAFYRDWPVLATASAVTVLDHVVRGVWMPQTVYGILTVSPWRWAEHAWWIAFEDFFLIVGCRQSLSELGKMALREAQLGFGAYHDALTGLANRRMLQSRFDAIRAAITAENRTCAILFVDLDRFKHVNDTLGHQIGDKLLAQVADRLATLGNRQDTVARIGGDEFVVMISREGDVVEHAHLIGNRILGAIGTPFEIEEHHLILSASVGISFAPDHGATLGVLHEKADLAMYRAKAGGRNQLAVFSPAMSARNHDKHQLSRDIWKALSRDEFTVVFQPQLGRNDNLQSFEALLRWNHPQLGAVPPSTFIPLAEEVGLIVPIGAWVLRQACLACSAWQLGGHRNVGVAVNVSAVQLEAPDYPASVLSLLEETGMDPQHLTLEVTETILLTNIKSAISHLTRLRSAGVRVALDDFGTGYSSLSYLNELPADAIKLDHLFVARATADRNPTLECIVDMAHRNGLQVTAEGVETRDQREFVHGIGCDQLQGYFYGRPMDAGAVFEYMKSRWPSACDETSAHGLESQQAA